MLIQTKCSACGVTLEPIEIPDSCSPTIRGYAESGIACDTCIESRDAQDAEDDRNARWTDALFFELMNARTPECAAMTFTEDTLLSDWDFLTESLFVHGPLQVGKTSLARKLLYRAFVAGYSVAETNGPELASIGASFDHVGQVRLKALSEVRVLLIDDIDKGSWNRHNLTGLWDVMNTRQFLATIVTTNFGQAECVRALEGRTDNPSLVRGAFERLRPCRVIAMANPYRAALDEARAAWEQRRQKGGHHGCTSTGDGPCDEP